MLYQESLIWTFSQGVYIGTSAWFRQGICSLVLTYFLLPNKSKIAYLSIATAKEHGEREAMDTTESLINIKRINPLSDQCQSNTCAIAV